MEKKIKICCVIPSLSGGGMERVMSVLANYFSSKNNVQVYLILYGKKEDVFYDLNPNIIVNMPKSEFNDKYRLVETIKRLLYLRRQIIKIHPLCVLSFGTLWNRFVLLSMLGTKIPIYISDRGNPLIKQSFFQTVLAKVLYPKASGIIAQTQYASVIYKEKKLNKNIIILPNPINVNENFLNNREKIVISVGRLISSKNFDRLIRIFQNIDFNDWKLLIVGGDADKQKNSILLKEQVDKAYLNSRVILKGTQKNINDYLMRASIFAFTSSSEGFPNVIGEAMSAGLPVISYDCVAGPSDMIDDGLNGYLIPLFDDEKFEEKLRYLMENENERVKMGYNAWKNIQKFSTKNICEQFYRFIIDGNL